MNMEASRHVVKTEQVTSYTVKGQPIESEEDNDTIAQAMAILARRMVEREVLASSTTVKNYCQLWIARKPHECFCVLFLDSQNRLIECEEMFRGTLAQTSVYPREVVKRALEVGAAAVILTHNHPSGTVQPSRPDEVLTQTLKAALALVDVRVLDHVIVAPGQSLSMAERGLL
jgi:DNA repair protein RadC